MSVTKAISIMTNTNKICCVWNAWIHLLVIYMSPCSLSPVHRQSMTYTNADWMLIEASRQHFSEIWVQIQNISPKEIHLKVSAISQPIYSDHNALKVIITNMKKTPPLFFFFSNFCVYHKSANFRNMDHVRDNILWNHPGVFWIVWVAWGGVSSPSFTSLTPLPMWVSVVWPKCRAFCGRKL